ncbi:MAG: cobalt transporter CbiM [Desulfobacterales bacterium]|nr:cobalt transporter CbiM [Desulfobacterales bacterium]
MHISEGVLSAPVLAGGAAFAVAGIAVGLKKLDNNRIPQAGILAAAFFVASLVHVPIGPSSMHLILNGIVGLLMGWAAFPVIAVALVLQAILFQFGGITSLGVNTIIMAGPAVLGYYLFTPFIARGHTTAMAGAFACGFTAVLVSALIAAAALMLTGEAFLEVSAALVAAHIVVMIIEGIITMFCVAFLKKVQPSMLSIG